LTDEARAQTLTKAAQALVKARYDLEVVAPQVLDAVVRALEGAPASRNW
jgi:hypothetical protein